ncbi:MAG TPA: nitrilase-related carbon-nitrogen hydrolase, partial [Candidatus Hydrogenedentes bacterium]|nr:nitrilase-related carbon-nitrogen hydrolase [Candidatus Hydrogenedentota bacterium]
MRLVKIAVASVSVKVGDYRGNSETLRQVINQAREQGAHLLVTPELAISGYSLEDRVFWPHVCRYSWEALESLAEATRDIAVFVGLPVRIDDRIYNAAALLFDGSIRGLILKRNLPTYSIFYEGRHWSSWEEGVTRCHGVPAGNLVFELPFGRVSAEICEDLFAAESPARDRVRAGAEIICNLSASPFTPLK